MFFHKFLIGLGSLVILHPVVKLFGFNWEQPTVDIDVITAAEVEDDEMSTNVFQNGVLFGVWVAGVAISMGRLLSYAIYGGGAAKNGIDVHSQTELKKKEEEVTSQESELEEVTSQESEVEEVEKIKVVNQESYTRFMDLKLEEKDDPTKIEDLGSSSNDEESIPLEEVSKEGKGEGSKMEPKLDEKEDKEDKEVKSETKISVYKLPAIKRHHFMVRQDGMKTMKQSVQGKFSLEKVNLDGVRNFIFIVAKGTPAQLSELETKVKADFRWLTPVREPSSELTGDRSSTIQEPKWVSSSSVNDSFSGFPAPAPRATVSPRARSPALRASLSHKTPNPNAQK